MSFIETERLLIRSWMGGDTEALHAIYADEATMRFIPTGNLDIEATRRAIATMTERYEREGFGVWPVVLKETGALAGECGLQRMAQGEEIELRFILARDAWGKGYAYEAARSILAFAASNFHLPRIVAVVDPRNARSIALVNRLGMRFERVARIDRRDLLVYSLAPA